MILRLLPVTIKRSTQTGDFSRFPRNETHEDFAANLVGVIQVQLAKENQFRDPEIWPSKNFRNTL